MLATVPVIIFYHYSCLISPFNLGALKGNFFVF